MSFSVGEAVATWHYGLGPRETLAAVDDVDAWIKERERACLDLLDDFGRMAGRSEQGVVLDLTCEDREGRPLLLEGAARLRLRAWTREDGRLELRRMHPLELAVTLHTDLFVPLVTHRDLASRNAARLAAFLVRIEERLHGELFGIEAPGLERMASSYGFHDEDRIGRAC
jgi:hypothetical protein